MTPSKFRQKKVLIVDDHAVVREGVKMLLEQNGQFIICGQAEDAQEALKFAETEKPDFAIVDISLKTWDGIELIKMMRQRFPDIQILVVSMHDESLYAGRAIKAGAKGFVMKQESAEKIIEALNRIQNGKIYLSETMKEKTIENLANNKRELNGCAPGEILTDRELEVFNLIGEGLGTQQIANRLFLSPKTIETYREKIKEKLNIENSVRLVQKAVLWVNEAATVTSGLPDKHQ